MINGLYKIAMTDTAYETLSVDKLFKFDAFKNFIVHLKEYAVDAGFVKSVKYESYHVIECEDHVYIGYVNLGGISTDENSLKPDTQIMEHRILTGDFVMYLYIMIESLPIGTNILRHRAIDNVFSSDCYNLEQKLYIAVNHENAISRMMSYYTDIVHSNLSDMTNLNSRDMMITQDPMIVLAKAWLLFHNEIMKTFWNTISKNTEQEKVDYFHLMDAVLFRDIGEDWVVSNSITLSDKANAFSPQLLLKQEIFDWLINASDNISSFEEFKTFFDKGEIYHYMNDMGYMTIVSYLIIGSNPFSTKVLNEKWKLQI